MPLHAALRVAVDTLDVPVERDDARRDGNFLVQFAQGRGLQRLADLDETARQGPHPLARRPRARRDQHSALAKHGDRGGQQRHGGVASRVGWRRAGEDLGGRLGRGHDASIRAFRAHPHPPYSRMSARILVAPPAGAPAATNTPELTVSELSSALKRTVEDRFGFVRVRGEISNFRGVHASGHAYFCLKDASARLDAVIWKTAFAKLRAKPAEGLEVIATGRITTFPGKSSYQIVIEALEPAGAGALMALLEERRKKLLAEGLFDPAAKRTLPYLPRVIGVVTSPTGAVIRDILHRLAERFPRRVLLWPVRVQGETAAAEIAAAVAGFDTLPASGPIPRPDVLIVARGGGSLEDLWSFNEEIVVRAVAACRIPVISAVGHETDTTLIDFVADLRAPTPTGAAEKCVPVRADLLAQTAQLASRGLAARRRNLDRAAGDLRGLSRALAGRDRLLALPRQRTDRAADRLAAATRRNLNTQRARLGLAATGLARHTPLAELRVAQGRLRALSERLGRASHDAIAPLRRDAAGTLASRLKAAVDARVRVRIAGLRLSTAGLGERGARAFRAELLGRSGALDQRWKLVESLGYRNVLARGFALVRAGQDGPPLKRAVDVAPGSALTIQFADAAVDARAQGGPRPFRKARAPAANPVAQGSLF